MSSPLNVASPSPTQTCLAIVRNTAEGSSSPQFNESALDRACEQIFLAWRKHVTEAEAMEQVAEFRRRCAHLADHFVLSEAELDATLEAVAFAMVGQ